DDARTIGEEDRIALADRRGICAGGELTSARRPAVAREDQQHHRGCREQRGRSGGPPAPRPRGRSPKEPWPVGRRRQDRATMADVGGTPRILHEPVHSSERRLHVDGAGDSIGYWLGECLDERVVRRVRLEPGRHTGALRRVSLARRVARELVPIGVRRRSVAALRLGRRRGGRRTEGHALSTHDEANTLRRTERRPEEYTGA